MSNGMSLTFKRSILPFIPLLAVALQTAQAAQADSLEIQALKQQIHELQLRVDRLEGKMHEGMPVNLARKVEPKPGGWREPNNWRLLDKGMEEPRIIAILGEPQQRKTIKKFEYLTYGDGEARLYMGRLSSWDAPSALTHK
jgi:hypothetical protein